MNSYDYYKKEGFIVIASEIVFRYLSKLFQSRKISDIADTTSGGTPNRNRKDYFDGKIPWIKSGELNNGLITCCEEYISEEGLKNSSAKLYPKGTLVLALYGATVGKVGILDFESSSNQAVCAIFENKDIVLKEYLFWFFRQKRKEYIEQSFGGAQPNISQKVVRDTIIPLPDMEIQRKVVDFLNKLYQENVVDENFIYPQIVKTIIKTRNVWYRMEYVLGNINEQINYIKHFRQNILQEAVQGKLVPQDPNDEPASILLERIKEEKERLVKEGKIKKEKPLPPISEDEIPYELPEGWEWCRLQEAIDVRDGTHDTPKYVESGGYPLVTGKDFYSGKLEFSQTKYISKEDYEKIILRSKVDRGDILFSMIGGNIGSMVIFEEDIEIAIKNVALFKKYYEGSVDNKYLFYFLKANINNIKTLSKGGAQPFVSLNILRNYLFALPPFEEQKRIVEKVDQLMALCDELEKNTEQSKKDSELLMQSVLQEAFKEA